MTLSQLRDLVAASISLIAESPRFYITYEIWEDDGHKDPYFKFHLYEDRADGLIETEIQKKIKKDFMNEYQTKQSFEMATPTQLLTHIKHVINKVAKVHNINIKTIEL